MITLLTYPQGLGQFSLSPFCVKAAYLLSLSGLPWAREDTNDPRKMPHAKLPVLRTDERLIADSDAIRTWLESQGAEFEMGLSDIQKAQSHCLIRMAEEHLYFQLVMDRWCNDDVWPTIREIYFHEIPSLLRKPITNGLRRSLKRGLVTHGLARFSPQERLDRLEKDLEAIQSFLWQSPFLMGEAPTAADLSVAPVLAAMRATPVKTPLSRRIGEDKIISEYLDRMDVAIPLP